MDTPEAQTPSAGGFDLTKIKQQALAVIMKPAEFFRSMPKLGGFGEPIVFLAVVSLIVGIIHALSVITTSFGAAIMTILLVPILGPLGAFVGAFIVFVLLKMMGSNQNYETTYRAVAYSAAIAPLTTLAGFIPYVGGLAGAAWGFYLMVIISTEVHQIAKTRAQIVWGILFLFFAVVGLGAENATRKLEKQAEALQQQYGEEMSPEEAGKMMGEFLKGMQQGAETGGQGK